MTNIGFTIQYTKCVCGGGVVLLSWQALNYPLFYIQLHDKPICFDPISTDGWQAGVGKNYRPNAGY